MKPLQTRELILCALFIALIALGTFIRIPVGGDVYTLQFLFTLLAGAILGGRLGALCVGMYIVMGLIGIPVFASGGGFGYVLQPTFGYLPGFVLQAWAIGKLARRWQATDFRRLADAGLGTINAAVLTIEHLRSRAIPIRGVIFNNSHAGDPLEEDNALMIEEMTGIKVIARVAGGAQELPLEAEALANLYQ